jgi:hypothetical protein
MGLCKEIGTKWTKCREKMRKTKKRKYIKLNKGMETRAWHRARDGGSKIAETSFRLE